MKSITCIIIYMELIKCKLQLKKKMFRFEVLRAISLLLELYGKCRYSGLPSDIMLIGIAKYDRIKKDGNWKVELIRGLNFFLVHYYLSYLE